MLKDTKKYSFSSTNSPAVKKKRQAYETKMEELIGFKRDKVVKYSRTGKWFLKQTWYTHDLLGLDDKTDWLDDKNEQTILNLMVIEYKDNFLAQQSDDFLKRHGNLHPDTRDKLQQDFNKLNPPAKPNGSSKTTNTGTKQSPPSVPMSTKQVNPEDILTSSDLLEVSNPVTSDESIEVATELPVFDVGTEGTETNPELDLYDTDFQEGKWEEVLQVLGIDNYGISHVKITWCKAVEGGEDNGTK